MEEQELSVSSLNVWLIIATPQCYRIFNGIQNSCGHTAKEVILRGIRPQPDTLLTRVSYIFTISIRDE